MSESDYKETHAINFKALGSYNQAWSIEMRYVFERIIFEVVHNGNIINLNQQLVMIQAGIKRKKLETVMKIFIDKGYIVEEPTKKHQPKRYNIQQGVILENIDHIFPLKRYENDPEYQNLEWQRLKGRVKKRFDTFYTKESKKERMIQNGKFNLIKDEK